MDGLTLLDEARLARLTVVIEGDQLILLCPKPEQTQVLGIQSSRQNHACREEEPWSDAIASAWRNC